MCTLVVLNEYVKGYPLIVAANRDERYDRKSRAPEVVSFKDNDFIRPWDNEKDGTWLGVARGGWFVGLTNQDDERHDQTALSRGKVVNDCLHAGNHSAACRVLASLEKDRYNPFNMVFGRPGAMMLCRVWAGHELDVVPLQDTINVITNDCWGDMYQRKNTITRSDAFELVEAVKYHPDVLVPALFELLSTHDEETDDPFQSVCMHAEEHAFGTRSTSIITVSSEGHVEYWYSEGHPCKSGGPVLVARLTNTTHADA